MLLEVVNEIAVLGHTDCQCGTGHWPWQDTTTEHVAEEAELWRRVPVQVLIDGGKGNSSAVQI